MSVSINTIGSTTVTCPSFSDNSTVYMNEYTLYNNYKAYNPTLIQSVSNTNINNCKNTCMYNSNCKGFTASGVCNPDGNITYNCDLYSNINGYMQGNINQFTFQKNTQVRNSQIPYYNYNDFYSNSNSNNYSTYCEGDISVSYPVSSVNNVYECRLGSLNDSNSTGFDLRQSNNVYTCNRFSKITTPNKIGTYGTNLGCYTKKYNTAVAIYTNYEFQGDMTVLGTVTGKYNLEPKYNKNISSIVVPFGYKVTLYDSFFDYNGVNKGRYIVLFNSCSFLSDYNFNKTASAILLEKISIYPLPSFNNSVGHIYLDVGYYQVDYSIDGGKTMLYNQTDNKNNTYTTLPNSFNDSITSMVIPPGYKITLFPDPYSYTPSSYTGYIYSNPYNATSNILAGLNTNIYNKTSRIIVEKL